jgi:hypothetical protein
MATVTQIVDVLRREAQCDTSEYDEAIVSLWVGEAILEHNAALSFDGSDLPVKEEQLVRMLAQIKICNARAAREANQASVRSSQGFGSDRDTPYYKNADMVARLRARYTTMCSAMGIAGATSGAGTIVVSRLSVVDGSTGVRAPYVMDVIPLSASKLTELAVAITSCKIEWTENTDETFDEYLVFGRENSAVLDPANIQPTHGIPKIADLATRLCTIYDPRLNAREFVGMTTGVPYHFVVVTRNKQGRYAYSNELVVTPNGT